MDREKKQALLLKMKKKQGLLLKRKKKQAFLLKIFGLCSSLAFFFFQLLSVDNLVSSPFFCSSVSLDKSVSLIKMRHLLAEARRDVKVF